MHEWHTSQQTRGCMLCDSHALAETHTDLFHQFLLQLDDLILQPFVEALDVVQGTSLDLQAPSGNTRSVNSITIL